MLYGQLRTSFGVFSLRRVSNVCKNDVTLSFSCELSQALGKTEFSSTAETRTKPYFIRKTLIVLASSQIPF